MTDDINTRPGSVVDKLQAYYKANPGEELSYADICDKFDCSYRTAYNAVDKLKTTGRYEVAHVVRLRVVGIVKETA